MAVGVCALECGVFYVGMVRCVKKLMLCVVLGAFSFAVGASSSNWEMLGDNKAIAKLDTFDNVQLAIDDYDCTPVIDISVSLGDLPSVMKVNGQDVKVTYSGKNGKGVRFVAAETKRGERFLLNEFRRKDKVVIDDVTYSALGFSRLEASLLKSCKAMLERSKNAI